MMEGSVAPSKFIRRGLAFWRVVAVVVMVSSKHQRVVSGLSTSTLPSHNRPGSLQKNLIATSASADSTPSNASPTTAPATPCVRICRYHADCYDGAVCIGCFREAFEIGQWSQMTAPERSYALQDAADRWQPGYAGSVSRNELLKQAAYWETIDGE